MGDAVSEKNGSPSQEDRFDEAKAGRDGKWKGGKWATGMRAIISYDVDHPIETAASGSTNRSRGIWYCNEFARKKREYRLL